MNTASIIRTEYPGTPHNVQYLYSDNILQRGIHHGTGAHLFLYSHRSRKFPYIHSRCNVIRILSQSYGLPSFLINDDFGIGTVISILTDQKIILIGCETVTSVAVFLTNLITKINSVIVPEFNFLSAGK